MSSTVAGVLLACLASCLFNGSVVLQAGEARTQPAELGLRLGLIARLLRRRRWLIGLALGAAALAVQTCALLLAPLTAVQPADAAGLLVLLALGSRALGERVGRRELAAVVAIIGGVAVLTAAAPSRDVTHVDGAGVLVPLAAITAIALAPLVLRRFVPTKSIVVVLAAGFAFALSAFAVKLVADALDRQEWIGLLVAIAVAAVGALIGTLSEQTAFQGRPATVVAPIIFVVELLVPVLLALTVVGESWAGSVAVIAIAIVVILCGAVVLARTPQVAALMGSDGGDHE